MKRHFPRLAVVIGLTVCAACAAPARAADLRRAVPADAYLAVHGTHNPERDFQRKYYQEVWQTVQETRIIERLVAIATTHMSQEDVDQAKAILDELRAAAAPIDVEAILRCREFVYAQAMQAPSAQHVLALRLGAEAAASTETGLKNLLGLIEKYSDGKVPVKSVKDAGATVTTLGFPKEIPFHPAVARIDDVLLISSSEELARRSLKLLTSGEGKSKFDDPRLREALKRLPEPEDALVFYDGKLQFSQLRGLGRFIRQQGRHDPNAERVAGLIDLALDEAAILDYEVTVEYTEANHNCSAAYGKLLPNVDDKLLYRVFGGGEPFEAWEKWVPADALSYSLTTGANLSPVYAWVVEVIGERFPEAQPALDRFEQWQAENDFHLDRDLLQAFSGEYVSVSLPSESPSMFSAQQSFTALRCRKPERIRELLHRCVDAISEIPAIKAQQLELAESKDLEGFEVLSASLLRAFGVTPLIGFRDGWMIVGSSPQAVEKVLDTRAGKGRTIADTKAFQQFDLAIEGPVHTVSYTNLAASTRQAAQFLEQAGVIVPMIVAMAGGQTDSLKPMQEILALLPSVGKIVARFDFFEARMSVTQAGDEPGSYRRRTVTVIRPDA